MQNIRIYVADYGAGKLSCIDLDYSMVYNPSQMTVNQLRRKLRKQWAESKEARSTKKTE